MNKWSNPVIFRETRTRRYSKNSTDMLFLGNVSFRNDVIFRNVFLEWGIDKNYEGNPVFFHDHTDNFKMAQIKNIFFTKSGYYWQTIIVLLS